MAAMIAGTVITAAGTLAAGNSTAAEADFAAKQYEIKATEEKAASQREAMQQKKETNLLLSRQQALASASGLGALDPTILDLAGDTAAEGKYREDLIRYGGDERAAGLRTQAAASRFSGKNAQNASYFAAAGTLASGFGSSMYKKYGGTGAPGAEPAYG